MWSLCTKDDVMSLTPITEAELRDEWSSMVEGLIRQHMGTPNLGDVVVITNEYHDGDGTNVLTVKKPPIVSVEQIRVVGLSYPSQIDGSVLLANDYVAFNSYIQLKYMTFPAGSLNVVIDYTSGSVITDDVVRLAAASMIVAIINYRKRFGADASIKWGTADQKAGEESPNLNVGLTSHLTTIMKRLLRRSKVRVR